jgi:hypothetical protein
MTCCLAHRRQSYWNLQDRAWVHADGWLCDSLAGQPAPAPDPADRELTNA